MDRGSLNPLFFAKDETRHQFWQMLTRLQAEQKSNVEGKSKTHIELQ